MFITKKYAAARKRKKSPALLCQRRTERNLEEGLSMIPLSISINHVRFERMFQKIIIETRQESDEHLSRCMDQLQVIKDTRLKGGHLI
jgi:hypothetical protein